MLYLWGRFMIFIITAGICQRYYYKIYSRTQKINIIKLSVLFCFQTVMLLLCFIAGIYNSAITNFILYFVNMLPLFLYKDKLKNKILIYFIIFSCLAGTELFISAFYIFLTSLFYSSAVFPQDLAIVESLTFFIPPLLIFLMNLLISKYIPLFLDKIYMMKLGKNIFLLLITFFIIVFNSSCLFSIPAQIFGYFTVVYILLFLLSLFLIFININDIINKYKKSKLNRYYQKMFDTQKNHLKNIDTNFKETRKKNHDFYNHMIIINDLLKSQDIQITNYIEELLIKYDHFL